MRLLSHVAERPAAAAVAVLVVGLLVCALPVSAGSLAVTNAAALIGAFGIEVTVGQCALADELVLEPPAFTNVFGSFSACADILANGINVIGATDFTAGRTVILGEGFSVASGVTFSVTLDDTLDSFAFVVDDTPTELALYSASYWIDLTNLTISDGDEIHSLVGVAADGTALFKVGLRYETALAENRLMLRALEDNGMMAESTLAEQPVLQPGINSIDIGWLANDGLGYLGASVNGATVLGLTDLDNGDRRLESIRWGAVSGLSAASVGSFALDEFAGFGSSEGPDEVVTIGGVLDISAPPANASYTGSTGLQTGRLTRSGIASTCASPKDNPGLFTATGDRQYDQYRFVAFRSGCATVTISDAGDNVLFVAAYDEGGLQPANPSSNYLADLGSSTTSGTPQKSFSFVVTEGQIFNIVVHENSPGGAIGQFYTLEVEGAKVVPDVSVDTVFDTSAPPESPSYQAATGFQTGRINRFGTGSACAAPKSNPGLFTTTGSRRADLYLFSPNRSGCAVVALSESGPDQAHIVAYGPDGFVASSPELNYLADSGSSANEQTRTFSFGATAGESFDLVVHEVQPGAGDGAQYKLDIANIQLAPAVVVSGNLDGIAPQPNPAFSFDSGLQQGRVSRNGLGSSCDAPKPNPGLFTGTGSRLYESFTFTPALPGCIEVTLASPTNGLLFVAAYDQIGFLPADPSLSYLSDPGSSPTLEVPRRSFSFNVSQGQPFTLVVHEVNPDGAAGSSYVLEVRGGALGLGPEMPHFEDGVESGDTSAWSATVP